MTSSITDAGRMRVMVQQQL